MRSGFDGTASAPTCVVFRALAIVFATAWLLVFGVEGQLLQQLDHFDFGCSVSRIGALIGGVWGFVDGCVGGFVLAWLYNRSAGG